VLLQLGNHPITLVRFQPSPANNINHYQRTSNTQPTRLLKYPVTGNAVQKIHIAPPVTRL
jgi:hypothetical protein